MSLFMVLNLLLLTIFVCHSHPLVLVVVLVLQVTPTVILSAKYFPSSWVVFMVILIFLGGLLIIFTYLASLIPNEFTKQKTLLWMLATTFLITQQNLWMSTTHNNPVKSMETFSVIFSSNMIPFMIIYLMSGLFVVMASSKKLKMPMKQN